MGRFEPALGESHPRFPETARGSPGCGSSYGAAPLQIGDRVRGVRAHSARARPRYRPPLLRGASRASSCAAKPRKQFLANVLPRTRRALTRPMCGEAFNDDLSVPVLNRYLLGMRGEAVPERLHIIQLLLRRELVEAWRRHH